MTSNAEKRRRMRILELARATGGFTPELLDDLYRDDPAGRAAHDAEMLRRDREARERPKPEVRVPVGLVELLREAADGPCADCKQTRPLIGYGSVRVCRGCAERRDSAAVKVEF